MLLTIPCQSSSLATAITLAKETGTNKESYSALTTRQFVIKTEAM